MVAEVVVSRIQNRYGTQDAFEALYGDEYTSAPGATSTGNIIKVNSVSGLRVAMRPQVVAGPGKLSPTTTIVSINVQENTFEISEPPTVQLVGPLNIIHVPRYAGIGGATGDGILEPGELAMCSDTRRVYIGNVNGEYFEITNIKDITSEKKSVIILPPSSTYVPIPYPGIDFKLATNYFTTVQYTVSDKMYTDTDPLALGVKYSKTGTLTVAAAHYYAMNRDLLVDTEVQLSDSSAETNRYSPPTIPTISFSARYNKVNSSIEILCMHNFPEYVTMRYSTADVSAPSREVKILPSPFFIPVPEINLQPSLSSLDIITYSVTDRLLKFSKTGTLTLAAVSNFNTTNLPQLAPATLKDNGFSVNKYTSQPRPDLDFVVQYDELHAAAVIYYKHNFSNSLVMNCKTFIADTDPYIVVLQPTDTFATIPGLILSVDKSIFTIINYSISDQLGRDFIRSGTLKVSNINPVSIIDDSVDTHVSTISVPVVEYFAKIPTGSNSVEVMYRHNYPTALQFVSTSIKWIPFDGTLD